MIDEDACQYVTVIEAGDVIARQSLVRAAEALVQYPETDCLYSDEDYLLGSSLVFAPFYKPDWSPEIQWAQPWFLGLTFCRTEIWLRAAKSAKAGFRFWEVDPLLRITEKTRDIVHIHGILYHRRYRLSDPPPDVAASSDQSGLCKLVEDSLQRQQLSARVKPDSLAGALHVSVTPRQYSRVTILIPTRDRIDLLQKCIHSVLGKTSYPQFDLLVIDNDSRESSTLRQFEEWSRNGSVRVLKSPGPFNFSSLINRGASHSSAPLILLLNNGAEVIRPDWLVQMVAWIERPGIGAVGAKLYYPTGTIQHAGVVLGLSGLADHPFKGFSPELPGYRGLIHSVRGLSCVTGACMLTRRDVFFEVGQFDEVFPASFGDVDYCIRLLTHGYRIVYTPQAELYHYESASRGYQGLENPMTLKAYDTIHERWNDHWLRDRFYHEELVLNRTTHTPR